MKIRNAVKIAAAAALFAAPVTSFAAAAVAAGGFDASTLNGNGTITTNHTLDGLTCAGAGINENGFTQEQCKNAAGDTLIHSVMIDPVSGFNDESYVQMYAPTGSSGIADKQHLTETVSGETFTSNAKLMTGNFQDVGSMASARIHLDQSVSNTTDFNTSFNFDERNGLLTVQGHDGTFTDMVIGNTAYDSTYTNTFKFENFNVEAASITATDTNKYANAAAASLALSGVRLDQSALLSDASSSITQTFKISERHGSFTLGSGQSNHPTSSTAWSAGDSIINTLIGQLVGNGATGSAAAAMAFGLHDFSNETTLQGAGVDSQVSANPASFYTPTYANTNLGDPFAAF